MANAIHQTEKAETLASVSAQYFALHRPDGDRDKLALAKITTAIREATPPTIARLSDVSDRDPLPEGTVLFIPTLRAFNRVVVADSETLFEALENKGFDHARKLLRYRPRQVIELLSPFPPEYGPDDVTRAWVLTAFRNLDGMDQYTAQHLYDVAGVRSLNDLARTDQAVVDDIIAELVAKHSRPEILKEQRHAERWVLEAKILTRKRVSELAKARGRMFRMPFAPAVAAKRAAFYEAHQEALGHDVTLVGYGRYGRLHIGPKYATNSTLWNMAAIVDPLLTRPQYRVSRLGLTRPDVPIFATFDDWRHEYFSKLDDAAKAKHVVEIALRPDVVYDQTVLYMRAGIKNVILPKPVTVNHEQFDQLSEEVTKHGVKAAVASQWHYSDLPHLIRREIKRLAGQPHVRLADVRLQRVRAGVLKRERSGYLGNSAALGTTSRHPAARVDRPGRSCPAPTRSER